MDHSQIVRAPRTPPHLYRAVLGKNKNETDDFRRFPTVSEYKGDQQATKKTWIFHFSVPPSIQKPWFCGVSAETKHLFCGHFSLKTCLKPCKRAHIEIVVAFYNVNTCFLVMSRYHELGFRRNLVEIHPTSLPDLSKPSRTSKKEYQNVRTKKTIHCSA